MEQQKRPRGKNDAIFGFSAVCSFRACTRVATLSMLNIYAQPIRASHRGRPRNPRHSGKRDTDQIWFIRVGSVRSAPLNRSACTNRLPVETDRYHAATVSWFMRFTFCHPYLWSLLAFHACNARFFSLTQRPTRRRSQITNALEAQSNLSRHAPGTSGMEKLGRVI